MRAAKQPWPEEMASGKYKIQCWAWIEAPRRWSRGLRLTVFSSLAIPSLTSGRVRLKARIPNPRRHRAFHTGPLGFLASLRFSSFRHFAARYGRYFRPARYHYSYGSVFFHNVKDVIR